MATANKFWYFLTSLSEKKLNLGSDVLKIYLTNATPSPSHVYKYEIAEIAAGFGYTAGGKIIYQYSNGTTNGVYALKLNAPTPWVASGGNIGPFRHVILYDSTAQFSPLICYWSYPSSITLTNGQSFSFIPNPDGVIKIT